MYQYKSYNVTMIKGFNIVLWSLGFKVIEIEIMGKGEKQDRKRIDREHKRLFYAVPVVCTPTHGTWCADYQIVSKNP